VTAHTVLRIAASTVVATVTGIATNLATADHASPWMWLAVGAVTVVSIGVAIWTAPDRGRPPVTRDRVHAAGRTSGGPTVTVVGSTVRGNVVGGDLHNGRSSGVALAVVGLVAGLGVGLAYPNDRHSDPPVVGTPGPTAPPTGAVPTGETETVAPAPNSRTPVTPGPAPHRTPVDPPPVVTPQVDPPPESPVGNWVGVDESWETLVLSSGGTYRWEHPTGTLETGRYAVHGSTLTLTPDAGASRTFGWSVNNALLTLTNSTGIQRQYGLV
jgi:hypothetical protein